MDKDIEIPLDIGVEELVAELSERGYIKKIHPCEELLPGDLTVSRVCQITGQTRPVAFASLKQATKDGLLVSFPAYDKQSRRRVIGFRKKTA